MNTVARLRPPPAAVAPDLRQTVAGPSVQSRLRAAAVQAAIGLCLLLPAHRTWAQAGQPPPRPGDPLPRVPQAPQLPRTLPAPVPPPAAAPQIVVETPMLIVNSAKRFTPVRIDVPVLIVNSSKTTPRR